MSLEDKARAMIDFLATRPKDDSTAISLLRKTANGTADMGDKRHLAGMLANYKKQAEETIKMADALISELPAIAGGRRKRRLTKRRK